MDEGFPDIVERKFQNGGVGGADVRVMQWNILADGYSSSSPTMNFCASPPSCLPWSFRYVQIMKHIEQLDADVVCLQEVDHYNQIADEMSKKGYRGEFLVRKDSEVHHGIALFHKTCKFDVLETAREYVHEENGEIGNQGLLVTVLSERQSKRKVFVGVIHLKAKRPFAVRRAAQTVSSLDVFKQISSKHEGVPMIWAGDFNGETDEAFHKVITDSSLGFHSSYNDLLGTEPEFTTWKIRPKIETRRGTDDLLGSEPEFDSWKTRPIIETRRTIDYIWYTTGGQLKVADVLLPMEDSLVPPGRHPSFDHPSDHISICADFKFV